MSDDAAFIAAIRAAPGDDAARLVYADWLEERGDPRAAYLRAEVALATSEWTDPRRGELLMSLIAIARQLAPEWLAAVSRTPVEDGEPDGKGPLVPGIPDEDVLRMHWNYGGGRGAVGYRHVPSGITVGRDCPPHVPIRQVDKEALAEFIQVLRERGISHGGSEELPVPTHPASTAAVGRWSWRRLVGWLRRGPQSPVEVGRPHQGR
jgi:uncharacterized protein (TIGR02996 family)